MPKSLILDASAWLSLLLNEPESDSFQSLFDSHTLIAPELIRYEVSNGIVMAQRRKRMIGKNTSLQDILEIVGQFPIHIAPLESWWPESVKLVQKHDLTFYDAAYVGLAAHLDLPLLTLDKKILHVLAAEHLESAF